MTLPHTIQPTPPHPHDSPPLSPAYAPPTLTPLGVWTALTLNISIPVGLNNVYNSSPFGKEF